jgi:plasmid stability protein
MMMAQVLVRDLEDEVVERLKQRARRSGRSLEAELRLILQQAAVGWSPDVLANIERIRARFAGRTLSDSAELIREDRDG